MYKYETSEKLNRRHRLEDLGVMRERLRHILEDDRFPFLNQDRLSKHDPLWWINRKEGYEGNIELPTEEELERVNDLLDDLRRFLIGLQENLWDLYSIAEGNE